MSTYKRFSGNYNITSVDDTGNVIIDVDTVEVFGNLTVAGNLTYINVTELNVTDPFILLNASNTGAYSANSGVLVHKTVNDFAGIRWSNSAVSWQVSGSTSNAGDTGTWLNLITSTGNVAPAGGSNTQVQFNDSGDLAGDATFTFDKTVSRVTIQGHEVFGNIGSAPVAVANSVALYHNAEGGGGTGLYFKGVGTEDELVSKTKAIVFSIIF
jgi:hypothetical protein